MQTYLEGLEGGVCESVEFGYEGPRSESDPNAERKYEDMTDAQKKQHHAEKKAFATITPALSTDILHQFSHWNVLKVYGWRCRLDSREIQRSSS